MANTFSQIRTALAGIGFALAGSAAQAINITLPTTNIDAEAVFSFGEDAANAMSVVGLSVSALGNTRAIAGSDWQFMMPVTEVSLNMSLLPLKLSPISGEASGSGLLIGRTAGSLALSNFSLDFKRNVMMADLSTSRGVMAQYDVFNFGVSEGLHLSTSGGLSMAMNLNNMMLTDGAQLQFASALRLNKIERALLPQLNFGSLQIDIAPSLRFDVSAKPYVASVPEVPTLVMMVFGMLGMAFLSRRRMTI